MMKTYSHARLLALDEAAAVLEPAFEFNPLQAESSDPVEESVMSQSTSQSDVRDSKIRKILSEGDGSSGWTRFR